MTVGINAFARRGRGFACSLEDIKDEPIVLYYFKNRQTVVSVSKGKFLDLSSDLAYPQHLLKYCSILLSLTSETEKTKRPI